MPRYQACSVCGESIVWVGSYGLGEPRPYRLDRAGSYVYDVEAGGMRRADDGRVAVDGPRFAEHWPCTAVPAQRAPERCSPGPTLVTVVPHTHWDREWYAPFQSYRLRLVKMVDRLLDLMDADPGFTHFLLDGQTAALDDYLEVRPENEPRLRALGRAGRLAAGPWTTLPDEFMVSGETLVRNLEHGIARAREVLGAAMPVGYSPDSFGHVAQMPQLLRLFGIEHALVWRGVPLAIDTTAFRWQAPDGSQVRAEYLPHGYSQGWRLPESAAELLDRVVDYDLATRGQRYASLLVMAGGDHIEANATLPAMVAAVNARQQHYHLRVAPLAEHLSREPAEGLPVWEGELRSSGRHSVIMGVTSNRMDVKLAAAAAERAVERLAEPLSALHVAPSRYPQALLRLAWQRLILNAAHDSACACSHDEVVLEVLDRYHQARQIGAGLADDAVAALAGRVAAPGGSVVVANPHGRDIASTVTVRAVGAGPWQLTDGEGRTLPSQCEPVPAEALADHRTTLADVDLLAGTTGAGRLAEWRIAAATVCDHERAVDVTLVQAGPDEGVTDLQPVWRRLRALAATDPARPLRLRVLPAPTWAVTAAVSTPVPAFGWSTVRPVVGVNRQTGPLRYGPTWMDNGRLRVEVDGRDGTWRLRTADGVEIGGLGRLVDGGDGGDTYNWSPPETDRIVDAPVHVAVEALTCGPVLGRIRVVADHRWPVEAVGDSYRCSARSDELADVRVETVLELRGGEPFVRVRTEWDNRVRDHRLRAHFPLPVRVSGSAADSAYAVVERGLGHEGNPYEAALPTYPARRFVDCGDGSVGLAVVHDGVFEYEVVGEGAELAVTLVRSVGYLSRSGMKLRPGPAGPHVPIPAGQVPGRNVRRYALVPHRGGWRDADLLGLAEAVFTEPVTAPVTGGGPVPAHGTRLRVDGAEVCALLRDDDGALLIRLLRTDAEPGPVQVWVDDEPARGEVVDLSGARRAELSGELTLRPWEIATLRTGLPRSPGTS